MECFTANFSQLCSATFKTYLFGDGLGAPYYFQEFQRFSENFLISLDPKSYVVRQIVRQLAHLHSSDNNVASLHLWGAESMLKPKKIQTFCPRLRLLVISQDLIPQVEMTNYRWFFHWIKETITYCMQWSAMFMTNQLILKFSTHENFTLNNSWWWRFYLTIPSPHCSTNSAPGFSVLLLSR